MGKQLIYTSCKTGIGNTGQAIQVYSYSKDLDNGTIEIMTKECHYNKEETGLSSDDVDKYPLAFRYKMIAGNKYYTQCKYIGVDWSGQRFGTNYIGHCIQDNDTTGYPIDYYKSKQFRIKMEPSEINSVSIPNNLANISMEKCEDAPSKQFHILLNNNPDNIDRLNRLCSTLITNNLCEFSDTIDRIPMWIGAISHLFPPEIMELIPISTFEENRIKVDNGIYARWSKSGEFEIINESAMDQTIKRYIESVCKEDTTLQFFGFLRTIRYDFEQPINSSYFDLFEYNQNLIRIRLHKEVEDKELVRDITRNLQKMAPDDAIEWMIIDLINDNLDRDQYSECIGYLEWINNAELRKRTYHKICDNYFELIVEYDLSQIHELENDFGRNELYSLVREKYYHPINNGVGLCTCIDMYINNNDDYLKQAINIIQLNNKEASSQMLEWLLNNEGVLTSVLQSDLLTKDNVAAISKRADKRRVGSTSVKLLIDTLVKNKQYDKITSTVDLLNYDKNFYIHIFNVLRDYDLPKTTKRQLMTLCLDWMTGRIESIDPYCELMDFCDDDTIDLGEDALVRMCKVLDPMNSNQLIAEKVYIYSKRYPGYKNKVNRESNHISANNICYMIRNNMDIKGLAAHYNPDKQTFARYLEKIAIECVANKKRFSLMFNLFSERNDEVFEFCTSYMNRCCQVKDTVNAIDVTITLLEQIDSRNRKMFEPLQSLNIAVRQRILESLKNDLGELSVARWLDVDENNVKSNQNTDNGDIVYDADLSLRM